MRFSSPPCIGSAVVALFIKRGESLFRGEENTYFQFLSDFVSSKFCKEFKVVPNTDDDI
jgi:hypothetical protein